MHDNDMEEKKMDPPVSDDDNDYVMALASSPIPLPQSPSSSLVLGTQSQGEGGLGDSNARAHHHHHHVHFLSQHQQPSDNASSWYHTPLQTKPCTESSLSSSWTEHTCRRVRDRTAFSQSIQGQQHQQRQNHRMGGNIRNRSDCRIISSWQQQPLYNTPMSSQQQHHQLPLPPTVPSFTQLDFPSLTPVATAITRQEARWGKGSTSSTSKTSATTTHPTTSPSWSAAVKKSTEGDKKSTADNDTTDDEDDTSTSSSSKWMQAIPPLPLLDSNNNNNNNNNNIEPAQSNNNRDIILHQDDGTDDRWKAAATPVSSYYTTMLSSTTTTPPSALLNDIGTILARSNRVDEARMRYRVCIETARSALEYGNIPKMKNMNEDAGALHDTEGLSWFRHKLLRGGGSSDSAMTNTASPYSTFDHNINNNQNWNDIVQDIHQHQKLDCHSEYVYSCNGLTPLGLEYICDPLPVLGLSLRNFISGKESRRRKRSSAATTRDIDMSSTMIEWVALIAARVNIASLDYRLAGGGSSDKLQQVLTTLELASEDCRDFAKFLVDDGGPDEEAYFQLLQAVVHSNIGIVKYRLNKVRESMTSFETAKSALEKSVFDDPALGGQGDEAAQYHWTEIQKQSTDDEYHDDDRFPPHHYLLLAVRLNLARVSLRLSKSDEASKYCDLILAENTTSTSWQLHRRKINSTCGSTDRYHHHGSPVYGRSNSSSSPTTSSKAASFLTLEMAMLAYEHDVDRRSQWLRSVAEHYITGLIYETKGEISDHKEAWHHYNRLLSLARVKLDHRHVYICTLLERRGAVLFEQRKLQCSMLSYLACLKILEHQQTTGSNVFNEADLSRVLYGVARVLHDREDYHDALHMYHRALKLQRTLAADAGGRPSLDIIKTLCNISRVHHLSGEIDAALGANREVMDLALILLDGKMEHPFLIHRLKIEGNILVGKSTIVLFQCIEMSILFSKQSLLCRSGSIKRCHGNLR